MESRNSGPATDPSTRYAAREGNAAEWTESRLPNSQLPDSETERSSRQRLFDEVLASVELTLVADGAAFWREEADHSLVLTASRSIPKDVLDAFDRHVTTPLQSIMQRWPESPLVAVPLNDPTNPIAEEIRKITDREEIVGLAGVPCRIPGEMLGMLVVVHRRPHAWTVRDLGLATGLAGQLATAMQNARLYSSVRALANRLTAIHELSLRLNQLRDVAAIGDAIVAEVGRLVDCDTVRVYRLDPEGVFRPVAASGTFVGIASPPLEALATGHGETLPGWVAKRNEPLIIPDASVERRSIFRSTFGPESLLLVPMSYGDSVQGVLVVSKQGVDKYGPEDEQALSIFGRYAAQAIVNADNIEELERQHCLLEQQMAAERRLLEVSEQLVSTLDPRRVLEQIAETIGTVVHYDRLTIYNYSAATSGIEPVLSRSGAGIDGDAAAGRSLDEGLTSWVIGRGDAVCANDVGEEVLADGPVAAHGLADGAGAPPPVQLARRNGRDPRMSHNIIVVPLRVHGDVVGSLNLTRVGGPAAHFTEHEFELSKLFAGQASIALQNAETHVTVSTRADLDALTGLRNHGTFQRDLTAMIELGNPFSLLMMDLDSFKAFNDTYGHPAGDTLLQIVAKSIVGATRQNDKAYRYGGDEFALLLFGASRTHAEEVAGRVRSSVREGVRISAVGSLGVSVSASIGAAQWPADGQTQAAVVEAADAALYRAKRQRTESYQAESDAATARPASPNAAAWPAAARDLIAAATVEAAATAMVQQVAILCAVTNAFVALDGDVVDGAPVSEMIGIAEARGDSEPILAFPTKKSTLKQVAASGQFLARSRSMRRGGLWSRVLESAKLSTERDGEGLKVGVPLMVGGTPIGLIGVVLPSDRSSGSYETQIALVADLGSAALERLLRPHA